MPRSSSSGAGAARAASAWPSRSSTRTGWPSSTRSSRITSRTPRTGARALDYLLKAAEKAAQAFGLRQALELQEQALAPRAGSATTCRPPTLMAIHRARADLFFARRRLPAVAARRPRPTWSWPAASGIGPRRPVRARAARLGPRSGRRTSRERSSGARGHRDGRGHEAQRPLAGGLFVRGYRPCRQRAPGRRGGGPAAGARHRAGGRRSGARRRWRCTCSRARGAGRPSTGRAWSWPARRPGSRASIAWSFLLSGVSGTRAWPRASKAATIAALAAFAGGPGPCRDGSATTPSSRAT